MTNEQVLAILETRGSRWLTKSVGVTVGSEGTVWVYKSRKEVFQGTKAEAAEWIAANIFPSRRQVQRQTTRKGGQYVEYSIRCEFCDAGIPDDLYDTVEDDSEQPYAICPKCRRKYDAGKLEV